MDGAVLEITASTHKGGGSAGANFVLVDGFVPGINLFSVKGKISRPNGFANEGEWDHRGRAQGDFRITRPTYEAVGGMKDGSPVGRWQFRYSNGDSEIMDIAADNTSDQYNGASTYTFTNGTKTIGHRVNGVMTGEVRVTAGGREFPGMVGADGAIRERGDSSGGGRQGSDAVLDFSKEPMIVTPR